MTWQTMMAMLHSNRKLGTEYGDTEKGCQKPAAQQKTTELNNKESFGDYD